MLVALDLTLLVLMTLRVSRISTTDNIGQWWLYAPLYKRAYGTGKHVAPRWAKYVEGLVCPFCVGFWIGCAALIVLALVGGPGHAPEWWRWVTGAFALNYVVGHVASRLD